MDGWDGMDGRNIKSAFQFFYIQDINEQYPGILKVVRTKIKWLSYFCQVEGPDAKIQNHLPGWIFLSSQKSTFRFLNYVGVIFAKNFQILFFWVYSFVKGFFNNLL